MGAKLVSQYEEVGRDLGLTGRMKLAMLTKIPSTQAMAADDSPANLRMFQDAIVKLRAELKR